MRKLIVVLGALLLLGGIAGSAVQGVIDIWADDTRSPIWEELRQEVEAQFLVAVKVTDWGKPEPLDENFKSAAPSGEGPDILVTIHDRIGTLLASGLLEPLEISDELRAQFNPGALAAFSSAGKLYAIPYAQEAIVVYYNKDLLPTPPATFEELLAAGKALMDEGKAQYAISWSVNQFFFSFWTLSTNGGFVFENTPEGLNGCSMGLDSEGAIQGGQFLRSLVEQGLMPAEGIGYGEALSLFKEGKVPFHINGPWEAAGLRDAGMNFGAFHIPSINGAQPLPFLGVQGFSVSAFSDDKTTAKAILTDYFATLDVQKTFFLKNPRIPVFLPLLDDPDVKADEVVAVVGSAPGTPMPNIPEMGNVWGAMDNAFNLIASGQESADSALHNAVATIKAANNCP